MSRPPATRPRLPALRRHVLDLASANGVAVEFANGRRAIAYRGVPSRNVPPRIRVPEIRGQVTYFTALHELGHLLSPGNRSLRQLEAEGDAWCWAFEHALVRPTPATARRLGAKLATYYRRAALRRALGRRVAAHVPGPDGLYWRVLAELQSITVSG